MHVASPDPIQATAAANPDPDNGVDRVSAAALADVVDQYCVRCHNERRMTGNLDLGGL